MTIFIQAGIVLAGCIIGMKVSTHVIPAFWVGFGTGLAAWLVGWRKQ